MTLPTNIDSTYSDEGSASRKEHQQHHDAIHAVVNSAPFVRQAGGDTITAATAATKGLVVKGAASQTANLAEFQNSAGTVLASVSSSGTTDAFVVRANTGGSDLGAYLQARATDATARGLVVRGAASQTANLAEFQNSAGTVLAGVTSAGGVLLSKFGTGSGGRLWSGTGVPDNVHGSVGDFYFRTDDTTSGGGRIYVRTPAGWGGLI